MKKIAPVAIAGLLLLVGAGCGNQVSVKTTAPAPAPQAEEKAPAPAAAPAPAPAAPAPAAPQEVKAKVSVSPSFKKGDKVLANWKNGSKWWEAVVTAVDGPAISVTYDADKTTDTLGPIAVVFRPTKAAVVKVGDKVAAKWNGGSFYGGTITAVSGAKATVKWGDGSAPSEVPLVDMVLVP